MLSERPHAPASEHTILDGLAHDNPLLAGEVYRRTAAPLTKATASAKENPRAVWWSPTNDSADCCVAIDGRPDGQAHRKHRSPDPGLGHRSVHSAQAGVTNSLTDDLGTANSASNSVGPLSGHDADYLQRSIPKFLIVFVATSSIILLDRA